MIEPSAGAEEPTPPEVPQPATTGRTRGSGVAAALIAAGILLSRVLGVVRNAFLARYLGAGLAADAFNAALRIPNVLNNLFGEGALSASFIPVYSRLLARGEREDATRLAGAVFAILAAVTAVLVLVGITLAPAIVTVINPGFEGERYARTVFLLRILFPGAAVFVLSAWSLGVLNSHRHFFLAYVAPVAWNVAMIVALLWYGPRSTPVPLTEKLAWASVLGAVLQFVVQLPTVLRLVPGFRPRFAAAGGHVRTVLRNFGPVAVSRGVVQISGFIDLAIASLLPGGAVSLMTYASQIYLLPVSLFGMSVSAAELPEMSSLQGDDEGARQLRGRIDAGLRRIAFFVVPTAVAFLALGDVLIAALLRSGRFGHVETILTWGILAGSTVGLLAGTMGRLYSSSYYALHDTRTPLRFAVLRILLGVALGSTLALLAPRLLGIDRRWGAAGLTVASGIAGWVEFTLLRRGLTRRIGHTGVRLAVIGTLWGAAALAALCGFGVKLLVAGTWHRFVVAALVFGTFAAVYGATTFLLGMPEAIAIGGRLLRRGRGRG